jgi:hypothetical protein
MNGDEWGLFNVIPLENLAYCQRVTDEFRNHHKDTEFSLSGWTTRPYVIPEPEVAVSSRGIRVADLESLIGTVMPKAAGVDSCVDYTGEPYPCPDCFAFALSLDNYWQCDGFYGCQKDEIVQALHVTSSLRATPAELPRLIDAIVQFGRRFDLILLANAAQVVDLRDVKDVAGFIDAE